MLRPLTVLLSVALALPGCGDAPQLNVEQKPADQPAAPAAATDASGSPSSRPAGEARLLAGHDASIPALPPDHPPVNLPMDHPSSALGAPDGAAMPVVPAGSGTGAAGLNWTAAKDWIIEPPANAMRRAQYRVPGPGGDAECVVFYLGPGQGGDPRTNAERWAGQFVQPGGAPPLSAMTTRTLAVGAASVLVVETSGTYMSGGMMGDEAVAKPGWALLGAVVPGLDADWYFKFTGPAATIAAQKAAFEAMIASIRRGG